jgi:tRNA 2-thiouridine synthesizing protein A
MDEQPINFVVFSGTDDKLQALAVMTAGAAALGKKVNIFLQYWALDAFTRAKIGTDHGLAPEAGPEGRAKVDARGLNCPMPIVKTAQAVKAMASGQTVEVLATDAGSVKDFAAWAKTTGNTIVEQTADGGVYRFLMLKK